MTFNEFKRVVDFVTEQENMHSFTEEYIKQSFFNFIASNKDLQSQLNKEQFLQEFHEAKEELIKAKAVVTLFDSSILNLYTCIDTFQILTDQMQAELFGIDSFKIANKFNGSNTLPFLEPPFHECKAHL